MFKLLQTSRSLLLKQHRLKSVSLKSSFCTTTLNFAEIDNIRSSKFDDFFNNGWCVIENFLTENEIQALESVYDKFLNKEISVKGKDFCDMSQQNAYNLNLKQMRIINVLLPRIYYPTWVNNIYELKSRALVNRLYKDLSMDIDYDQLIAKTPHTSDSIFSFHQDASYWPDLGNINDSTVTFSLSLDGSNKENGCIAFLTGTHKESELREHKALSIGRETSHTIGIQLTEHEINKLEYAIVPRGGISIHNHTIIHGSFGNNSNNYRRTYVIAYRTKEAIKYERSIGFTHSHNDDTQIMGY